MEVMNYDVSTSNKKRVRASQACVHCRKKKIKCDETRPFCRSCIELDVQCEYTEPKKRGPRKGYVQLLEERLATMEKKMKNVGVSPTSDDEENRLLSPAKSLMLGQFSENSLPPPEIVNHLVDLFFKYINSVIPFIHRSVLKKSIQDGTVSHPLLYSVMALSARFSEHPSIRTDPPYLAGENFAQRAISLVDSELLEPNLANIQFWGIMSCLEYGRASGSKSWIYAGLAIKFCQELGLYKEETLRIPILADDGSIDTVAMALRRRVFWSCLCIDKLSCAGTHRPQCIDKSDCDAICPSVQDSLAMRDPVFHTNVDGEDIGEDSLMNIATYYMKVLENYGEANKYMNRAKNATASIVWPPIAEFSNLDRQLRAWQESLPQKFHFTQENLDYHRKHASFNYLNLWLCSYSIWMSANMILHRGSLAYADISSSAIPDDLYRRIQTSIGHCRVWVDSAMSIFGAIKDLCGSNTLPYIGFSAYVFATVLMTSTFSDSPESCEKSGRGLKILYELIDGLGPYWPMCERLASATHELIVAHQRIYNPPSVVEQRSGVKYHVSEVKVAYPSKQSIETRKHPSSTHSSRSTNSPTINALNELPETHPTSLLLGTTSSSMTDEPTRIGISYSPQQQGAPQKSDAFFMPSPPTTKDSLLNNTSQQPLAPLLNNQNLPEQTTLLSSAYSNWNKGSEIDFNSLDFLYNTGLFGQVVLDGDMTEGNPTSGDFIVHPQQGIYQGGIIHPPPTSGAPFVNAASIPISTSAAASSSTNYPSFAPII